MSGVEGGDPDDLAEEAVEGIDRRIVGDDGAPYESGWCHAADAAAVFVLVGSGVGGKLFCSPEVPIGKHAFKPKPGGVFFYFGRWDGIGLLGMRERNRKHT